MTYPLQLFYVSFCKYFFSLVAKLFLLTIFFKNLIYFWMKAEIRVAELGSKPQETYVTSTIHFRFYSLSKNSSFCNFLRYQHWGLGLDEQDWGLGLDEQDWGLGLDEQDWGLGLDEQDWGLGLDEQDCGLGLDEEDWGLGLDEQDWGLGLVEEDHTIV